jgi:hypothetical protein
MALCPPTSDLGWVSYRYATVRRMNKLRGIELRYVLTMQLFIHGPATIKDLVEALACHGFEVTVRPVNRCRTRCGGSRAAGGRAASRAAYTVRVKCRAALSTGFIDEYWRCGPKQIARRWATRASPPTETEVPDVITGV